MTITPQKTMTITPQNTTVHFKQDPHLPKANCDDAYVLIHTNTQPQLIGGYTCVIDLNKIETSQGKNSLHQLRPPCHLKLKKPFLHIPVERRGAFAQGTSIKNAHLLQPNCRPIQVTVKLQSKETKATLSKIEPHIAR